MPKSEKKATAPPVPISIAQTPSVVELLIPVTGSCRNDRE